MSAKILFLTICIYGTIQCAVQAGEVHRGLTEDQIKKTFHRNEAPKYQTVMLKASAGHRSKRDLRPVEFDIEGQKIQLELTELKHQTLSNYIPVWTVETDRNNPSGHTFKKVDSEKTKIDGVFYQDIKKMAMMLAYYKDRYIYYDGIFGESNKAKIVRSLPEKWWKTPGTDAGDDHIIFDVDQEKGTTNPIVLTEDTREKLDKPLDALYPKLLIIVENGYFKQFNEDISETIKYVATFWNAVNLEYSKLKSPPVKIVITGVIISKDDTALNYIYDSRNQTDLSKLNNMQLLSKGGVYFRDHFAKEVDFKNYDSTITMTNLDTGAVLGTAYVGQVCSKTYNIGFIRDDASYSGLHTATHELGHLLDLPHDGEGRAKNCDGYAEENVSTIMGAYSISVDKYVWSECSKKIIETFASLKSAECLRNPSRTR